MVYIIVVRYVVQYLSSPLSVPDFRWVDLALGIGTHYTFSFALIPTLIRINICTLKLPKRELRRRATSGI